MYQYRAVYYFSHKEKPLASLAFNCVEQAINHLDEMGKFKEYTGGDIEVNIPGIGWVHYQEQD